MERSASRREEVSSYRKIATERVLNSKNPWELEVNHSRQVKYSAEADTFLVICVWVRRGLNIDCVIWMGSVVTDSSSYQSGTQTAV